MRCVVPEAPIRHGYPVVVRRLPTTAVLLLTLAGVASGNLYQVCDCAPDEQASSSTTCGRTVAEELPPCCRGPEPSAPAPSGEDEDDCRLCCKPRAPMGEVEAPSFETPAPLAIGETTNVSSLRLDEAESERTRPDTRRRTIDPWLLSPEGLAVFLI